MKKIILCSVPMKAQMDLCVYTSGDSSLPASARPVRFPICSFLERTLQDDDELKVLLLTKRDPYSHCERNADVLREELAEAAAGKQNVRITYTVIETDFAQTRAVHTQLMGRIVDELETGAHILADITYGSKDLPVIIFVALHFAEKFLDCVIDHILYGQASFENGHAVDTRLCDMSPLYCLDSVTGLIRCDDPDKARNMLKALLSQ